MRLRDRKDAGRKLAAAVRKRGYQPSVVAALPRGGVPVAAELAAAFHQPLKLIITRKIPHPFFSEYAIGAVADGGSPIYNERETGTIPPDWLENQLKVQLGEIERRKKVYGALLTPSEAEGEDVLLVDDGIATGYTMLAAVTAVASWHPRTLAVAVPIFPQDLLRQLTQLTDEVIYLEAPEQFAGAVSVYYDQFEQVSDEEVKQYLHLDD